MTGVNLGVLLLVGSVGSWLAIIAYELHRGRNKIEVLGWSLAYLGILPGFVRTAFDLSDDALLAMGVFGLCSMLVGFGLLWKVR